MNLTSDSTTNNLSGAFLRGLVLPLALLILALKSLRILGGAQDQAQYDGIIHLFRSDILVLVLFTLLGLTLVRVLKPTRGRIALGLLQVTSVVWGTIETIAHQFYAATGSTMDFGIFWFSVQRLDDLGVVVASEIPVLLALMLSLVVLTMLFLPWYIVSHVDPVVTRRKPVLPNWVAIGGLLSIASIWSLIPLSHNENPGFTRSNLINFAWSGSRLDGEFLLAGIDREPLMDLAISPISDGVQKKNLVIVILESTRASATTLHNPALQTTPFLDSLKERSLFAEQAYAIVPHTSKALVAIHCGIEPHLTMPITEAESTGIPAKCLPDLLEGAGYRTVFFQSATKQFEAREGLVSNLGYEEFFPLESLSAEGFEVANYFSVEDAAMLPKSLEWLQANGKERAFLATYLTGTPHHDYRAPRQRYGSKDFSADDEFNRYLNSVWYVDQFTRELVEQYKAMGLLENTVFIILGDHGEAFNEHGRSLHDNVLWQEGLHIPLLIYDPANETGGVIKTPVNQLDVMPSVMALLGYRLEGGRIPGEIMWNADGERTLYAHCWYELGCMAAIENQSKYIEHFGRLNNEFYDLRTDAQESNNLHSQLAPQHLQQIKTRLFSWRQAVNRLYKLDSE